MRTHVALLIAIAGCHPSATVEHTMPVANLQTYRSVALRVHASAFAGQGQAMFLEQQVLENLRQKCAFQQVTGSADVIVDLNITQMGRGGTGFIQNQNQATVDALLVLTDGVDGQLLGTAKIHGKSSGMILNNGSPESEATGVVAQTVAEMLAKSGCSGPRVARAEPPPPPPPHPDTNPNTGSGTPPPPPVDESHRAEAEGYNDKGKEKLYAADYAGALASFQQANALLPDPKYVFNECITFGAQEQWDAAVAACHQARGMNPPATLATKIDTRIDLLQHRQ